MKINVIDAIVPKLKTIYRFDTEYQCVVENFCHNVLNLTTRTFFLSQDATVYPEYKKYGLVNVRGRIVKKAYKYRIG